MRRLVLPILILAAIIASSAICFAAADEYRAFWIDAWGTGVLSQTEVNNLLGTAGTSQKGQIRDANCNMVIVQVRRNCDANYPSSMGEPYMSGLSPAQFNSLQAVINAAHDTTGGKQRVEVHAWMVTYRTSGGAVYAAHSSAPTGSLTTLDNYWPSRDDTGAEVSDKAFDPGHPLAEEYTVNVFMDVVNNFDIDGVHYDYIRFTANNQGYNPTSIARYNARYGLTGQPAATNEQFKQWRRDQVSATVRKVYAKVQASKPNVKVSGSFVTWNPAPTTSTRAGFQATRPYYDVYADWDSWMQEGIVDVAVPMTYYNYASLPTDWTKWINYEKDRHGNRHMIIGPGIYLNSLSNAILEIQQTRTASPSGNYAQGFSGYSYRVPYVSGTWAGFAPSLLAQVTPTTANLPAMPWKTAPTKGHISGTVTIGTPRPTGAWADGATVSITGPETRSMLTDGTGFYAFIDLTPGSYVVTAAKSGYPNQQRNVNVGIGSVTGNMYVNDFVMGSGTPAPTITAVSSSGVTTNAATVTWTTDQASSSWVEYGTTTSYGSSTNLNPGLVTSHSQGITGLTPGITYHYRVTSANTNGSTTSGDYTFTTVGPPAISNVTATGITNNAATITWTTDQASSSQVGYGTTTSYGSSSALDSAQVTSHSVTISGLSANTLYHYRVLSGNANGTRTSIDFTFSTFGPPTITSPSANNITATSVVITWTTSSPTNGTVNYGTTASYGNATTDTNTSTTSHSVTLTNLSPTTTYHYQCVSANAYGTAQTTDLTFTTIAVANETIVDNTDPGWTNTGNSGGWTSGSYAGVPRIGSNYVYFAGDGTTTESSITRKCRWTPSLPATGTYDVYAFYQVGTNRNTAAPFVVHYNGGIRTSIQNQYGSSSASGWFLVGQDLPFLAGTAGYLELTTLSADTKLVSADAAKFVLKSLTDTTAPVMSSVTGNGPYTTSTTTLNGTWSATDPETGIQRYEYAVGTTAGGTETKGWTSAGVATSADITGLSLTSGTTYYISARAVNGANLTSAPMTASGVMVDTTAPMMGTLTDEMYTLSTTSLQASWTGSDPQSGILRYEYALGDTPTGSEIRGWTGVGTSTSTTISGLSLVVDGTYYISVRAVNNAGLTSDPVSSMDGVTVATPVAGIAAAKSYDNEKAVYLPARTITAKFANRFYVEEADRLSGICVDATTTSTVGQKIPIFGKLGLLDGERALRHCKVIEPGSAGADIDPLAMITRSIGGGVLGYQDGVWSLDSVKTPDEGFVNEWLQSMALNNIGLLVTTFGNVTYAGDGYFYVDDGAMVIDGSGHSGVKILAAGLTFPSTGMVRVTGISSCDLNAEGKIVRMIHARSNSDIAVIN